MGLVLSLLLVLLSPAALAQDDDDDDHDDDDHGASTTAVATGAASDNAFHVFLYQGDCAQPGDVVDDIGSLDRHRDDDDDDDDDGDDHAAVWQRIGEGATQPENLWAEEEDIHPSLDELLSGDHAIAVHERDSQTAIVACGMVAGELDDAGGLLIELDEVDGSGFVGRALLTPHTGDDDHDDDDDDDDDDHETDVSIGMWESVITLTAEPTPTP
jgi:hypothetical protein